MWPIVLLAIAAICVVFSCAQTPVASDGNAKNIHVGPVVEPKVTETKPANFPGVHNVVAYSPQKFSGSVPEGAEGFETLTKLGITTIISVDGAAPEIDKARVGRMRYVHLPIGYDGVDDERTLEIARAIQDAKGSPVYLHCHHGKHRSAGALWSALVALGELTPEDGVARMKVSGTNPNDQGLYVSVATCKVATPEQLASVNTNFPEISQTSGMVQIIVESDRGSAPAPKFV